MTPPLQHSKTPPTSLTPMALFQRAADLKVNPNQACVLLAMVSLGIKGTTATVLNLCAELGWARGRAEGHIRAMKWCRDYPLLRIAGKHYNEKNGKPADVLELLPHGKKVLHGLLTGDYQRIPNNGGRPKGTSSPRLTPAPTTQVRVQPYRRAAV